MSFLMLGMAVASGVSGTLFVRASQGFQRLPYGLAGLGAYGMATIMMAWLVQHLPVGVVYAVWTGSAAVVLTIIDTLVLKVPLRLPQLMGMLVVIAGVGMLGTVMH